MFGLHPFLSPHICSIDCDIPSWPATRCSRHGASHALLIPCHGGGRLWFRPPLHGDGLTPAQAVPGSIGSPGGSLYSIKQAAEKNSADCSPLGGAIQTVQSNSSLLQSDDHLVFNHGEPPFEMSFLSNLPPTRTSTSVLQRAPSEFVRTSRCGPAGTIQF